MPSFCLLRRYTRDLDETPQLVPLGTLCVNLRRMKEAQVASAAITRCAMLNQSYNIFVYHADGVTHLVKKAALFLDAKLQGPSNALVQPGTDHLPKWIPTCLAEAAALTQLCSSMLGAPRAA